MNLENELQKRITSKCELCGATENLFVYDVTPNSAQTIDTCILSCDNCIE